MNTTTPEATMTHLTDTCAHEPVADGTRCRFCGIAATIDLPCQTASALVDALEARGMIEPRQCEEIYGYVDDGVETCDEPAIGFSLWHDRHYCAEHVPTEPALTLETGALLLVIDRIRNGIADARRIGDADLEAALRSDLVDAKIAAIDAAELAVAIAQRAAGKLPAPAFDL